MEFEIFKEDNDDYRLVMSGALRDSFWLNMYLQLQRMQDLDLIEDDGVDTLASCFRWIFEGGEVTVHNGSASLEDQVHNLQIDIKEIREELKCLRMTS